jgi:hypothetical protein
MDRLLVPEQECPSPVVIVDSSPRMTLRLMYFKVSIDEPTSIFGEPRRHHQQHTLTAGDRCLGYTFVAFFIQAASPSVPRLHILVHL